MGDSPKRALRCPDNIEVNLGLWGNRGGLTIFINTRIWSQVLCYSYISNHKNQPKSVHKAIF